MAARGGGHGAAGPGGQLGYRVQLGLPFTWPLWLTPDVVRAVRTRVDALAGAARPLGADRAGHDELWMVREGARVVRGTGQVGANTGVPYEAPLLDDRVVEACLAVRRAERVDPLEFKPLMKEAMRGRLPEDFLRRSTKTGGTAQSVRGFAAHHAELVDFCAASPLAQLGIIDVDALRQHNTPRAGRRPDGNFHATVNCAVFLHNHAHGSGS